MFEAMRSFISLSMGAFGRKRSVQQAWLAGDSLRNAILVLENWKLQLQSCYLSMVLWGWLSLPNFPMLAFCHHNHLWQSAVSWQLAKSWIYWRRACLRRYVQISSKLQWQSTSSWDSQRTVPRTTSRRCTIVDISINMWKVIPNSWVVFAMKGNTNRSNASQTPTRIIAKPLKRVCWRRWSFFSPQPSRKIRQNKVSL